MHISKYQCYMAARCTYQLPLVNSPLLAVKQSPNDKYLRIFWNGPAGRKKKTERVTGLGRRTRKLIIKWNQMTALRLQTVGGWGG